MGEWRPIYRRTTEVYMLGDASLYVGGTERDDGSPGTWVALLMGEIATGLDTMRVRGLALHRESAKADALRALRILRSMRSTYEMAMQPGVGRVEISISAMLVSPPERIVVDVTASVDDAEVTRG